MSVFPSNSTQLTNLFHAFARTLKANGECKLSGNSLLDRFASAGGHTNKRTICSLLDKENHPAAQSLLDVKVKQGIPLYAQETAETLAKELVKYVTKSLSFEFTEDKKLAPDLIQAALLIKDGILSVDDAIRECLWEDFDDGDGYLVAENFTTNIRPLLLADVAYLLAENEWFFSMDELYAMGVADGMPEIGTAQRAEDFSRDFTRDCVREIYPNAFEAVLFEMSKTIDRREPRIDLEVDVINDCAKRAVKQLFTIREKCSSGESNF